jgi:hypothetical protein
MVLNEVYLNNTMQKLKPAQEALKSCIRLVQEALPGALEICVKRLEEI